ncbi:Virulence factor EsxB [Streptococcus criceti]|uniref:WXG100 family type VII secretion target n=1 Tax=Streptococcus criceti HS-6 TaxID=873449 RepID=G5JNU3_STRCG|nr:hypothetical protein [Streptococcus criceti]EHI73870.1 hypothetical protein STRCR_0256 [Streptococcus criceti HS-6]SUN41752.1 Virulence factor EsxB [Streptococcus criceti]
MSDIMDSNINSEAGMWSSSEDTITYDDSGISSIKSQIKSALGALNDMAGFVKQVKSYDVSWKGEAKDTYSDLMTFLDKYHDDFKDAVNALQETVDGLNTLIDDIPSAKVLKEIDNA